MRSIILCFLSICLFNFQIDQIESAKILGVFPAPGKSHFFVGQSLMKALHEAGHEITFISPFTQKTSMKNWRDIETSELLAQTKGNINKLKFLHKYND